MWCLVAVLSLCIAITTSQGFDDEDDDSDDGIVEEVPDEVVKEKVYLNA